MKPALQMGCESIRLATTGEPESLNRLADSVRQRIYPYIRRVIFDRDASADLTQDTLVRVLSSLPRLRDVDRFWPWVYTIAANTARRHLQIKRRKREILFSVLNPETLETQCSPLRSPVSDCSKEESVQRVMKAVSGLRRRYREAFSLRVFKGLSYKDIAGRLGRSEVSARCLVLRAKRTIIQQLADDEGGVSRLSQTRYDHERRLIS